MKLQKNRAFSTTGNIEGQWFVNGSNELVGLSEEFLSDCDSNDCGMFGGWPYLAMVCLHIFINCACVFN